MLLESSEPICLQDRIRVLGCGILQPNTGKTVLAGEGQQCQSAGVFPDGRVLRGPALGCSVLPCLPDPFGSLILVKRRGAA